jgi:hypothetical protein
MPVPVPRTGRIVRGSDQWGQVGWRWYATAAAEPINEIPRISGDRAQFGSQFLGGACAVQPGCGVRRAP